MVEINNTNPFSNLWGYQKEFADKACKHFMGKSLKELDENEKISESKDYILSIFGEGKEVLDTFNWKRHRKVLNSSFDRNALLEELIDMQKFLWGLMAVWDIKEEEFYKAFIEKSMVVEHRWRQELGGIQETLKAHEKIAVVDIDGVLADYPSCFIEWVKENKDFSFDLSVREDDPLHWRSLKHEYRMSGIKRDLPVVNGAPAFVRKLKEKGYFVLIATSRPVSLYPHLTFDTIYWLKTNEIEYDYLLFSDVEEKVSVLKDLLKNVACVFDDEQETIDEFKKQGINAFKISLNKNPFKELIKKL